MSSVLGLEVLEITLSLRWQKTTSSCNVVDASAWHTRKPLWHLIMEFVQVVESREMYQNPSELDFQHAKNKYNAKRMVAEIQSQ